MGTPGDAAPSANDSASRNAPAFINAPLAGLTIALLIGVALSDPLGSVLSGRARLVVLGMSAVLAVVTLCLTGGDRVRPMIAASPAVLAAALVGFARHQAAIDLPADHIAHLTTPEPVLTRIEAIVQTEPVSTPTERRNSFAYLPSRPVSRFVVFARRLLTDESPARIEGLIRVELMGSPPALSPGDVVVLSGWLRAPSGPSNPGETDWKAIFARQGIHAILRVDSADYVQLQRREASAWQTLTTTARRLARAATLEPYSGAMTGDESRLIDAIVLGQRSSVDRRINEAFLRTGTIHFLTVSGFHVAVIFLGVWWATLGLLHVTVRPPLRIARAVSGLVILVTMAMYLLVAEPNPPVLRACLVVAFACCSACTSRGRVGVNSLLGAALLIVMYSPQELFRTGFQLSFSQVLVLMTIVVAADRRLGLRRRDPLADPPPEPGSYNRIFLGRLGRVARGLLLVSVICWFSSLPLVAFHFGRVAPYGAVQSFVLTPFVVVVVWLGFASLLLGFVPGIGELLRWLLHGMSGVLIWVVEWLARLPGTLIDAPDFPAWSILAVYAIAVAWWITYAAIARRRATEVRAGHEPQPKSRPLWPFHATTAGVMLLCLTIGWLAARPSPPADLQVWILDFGSGSAAVVVDSEANAGLIDVGTNRNFDAGAAAQSALRAVGAKRLRWVVITNARGPRISGLRTILNENPDATLYVSGLEDLRAPGGALRSVLADVPNAIEQCRPLVAGDRVKLGSVELDVIWPEPIAADATGPGDRSLVFRLRHSGRSILFTGDVDAPVAQRLVADFDRGATELRADVLIAPNNGALPKNGDGALLARVEPQWVVASTSTPRPQLSDLLLTAPSEPVRYLETRDCGAICIEFGAAGALRIGTPFRGGHLPTTEGIEAEPEE